jgi:hypothetical protein
MQTNGADILTVTYGGEIVTSNNPINLGSGKITCGDIKSTNIGIGSDTPEYSLDVVNDSSYLAGYRNTSLTKGIGIGCESIVAIGSDDDQEITIDSKGSGNVVLRTNNTSRLTVLGDGNVGIGNVLPSFRLDVADDNDQGYIAVFRNVDNTKALGFTGDSIIAVGNDSIQNINISSKNEGNVVLQTDSIPRVTVVGDNGYVGIGIQNPESMLDVDGAVKVHSNLNVIGKINNITPTELNYLSGLNYNIKSQVDNNSNDLALYVRSTSNYAVASSNVISNRITDTSNFIVATTSNTISNRISDTCNYVLDTSNLISDRITNINTDAVPTGTSNRFIVNDIYNNVLNVNGRLSILETDNENDIFNVSNLIGEVFTIVNDGKVGIGTTIPNQRLDVNGNINISGNYMVNDEIFKTSQWTTSNNMIYYNVSNIGIGTFNPSGLLTLYGNSADIKIQDPRNTELANTSIYLINGSNSDFSCNIENCGWKISNNKNKYIITSGSNNITNERFVIDGITGNVGVGKQPHVGPDVNNDTYKMNIGGSINIEGYIYNNGKLFEVTARSNMGVIAQNMSVQTLSETYRKKRVMSASAALLVDGVNAESVDNGWRFIDNDLDNGFVIKIKPSHFTSKILINLSCHIGFDSSKDSRWWGLKLYRMIEDDVNGWVEVSEANGYNSAGEQGVECWLSHNLGANLSTYEYSVANVNGSYFDQVPNIPFNKYVYYTAKWKSRLGNDNVDDKTGGGDLYLNRPAKYNTSNAPSLSSSLSVQEIWQLGTPFIPSEGNHMITFNDQSFVGVGNTTPQYPLDVSGDVNISGIYKKNGVDIVSNTINYVNTTSNTLNTKVDNLNRSLFTENLSGNKLLINILPIATSSTYGVIKPDNDTITIDQFGVIKGNQSVDLSSYATIADLSAVSSGLNFLEPVDVATTANVVLSGNTSIIDDNLAPTNTRILVKNQTTASANGIYTVTSGAWIRTADFASPFTNLTGSFIFVKNGTINGNSGYVCNSTNPINFVQFSSPGQLVYGNGINKTGSLVTLKARSDGGIIFNNTEALINLSASLISGVLPISKGGTGTNTLNNLITLGTHTTGNFVENITSSSGISISGASGVKSSHQISVLTKTGGGLIFEDNGKLCLKLNDFDITGVLSVADGGTGASTLDNLITLGSHTTGNYVSTITSGSGITTTGTSVESSVHILSIDTKTDGGLIFESNKLALDLGATAITGILGVVDGGTGTTTLDGLITLGTHTTGNYVKNVTPGSGLISTGTHNSVSADHTLSVNTLTNGGIIIDQNKLSVNLGGAAIAGVLPIAKGGTGSAVFTTDILSTGTSNKFIVNNNIDSTITITGNFVPSQDDVFSLGTPTRKWKDIYVGANSLIIGNTTLSSTLDGGIEMSTLNFTGKINQITSNELHSLQGISKNIQEQIIELNLDNIANGITNKYLSQDNYDGTLSIASNLNVGKYFSTENSNGNLHVYGDIIIEGDIGTFSPLITQYHRHISNYNTGYMDIYNIDDSSNKPSIKIQHNVGYSNMFECYSKGDAGIFVITSNGNVGINKVVPTERLDIDGNIKVSGKINNISSSELIHLSGINFNIKDRIDTNNSDQSNYVLNTSNKLYRNFSNLDYNQSNNILIVDTFLKTRVTDVDNKQSNYLLITSNVLYKNFSNLDFTQSNYILNVNTLLSSIVFDNNSNQSNYLSDTSNIISTRITDTCNYIDSLNSDVNLNIIRETDDTSNYIKNTSNNITDRIIDTCNYIASLNTSINTRVSANDVIQSNYVLATSNIISNRVNNTSNYITDINTSLNNRVTNIDSNHSNYLLLANLAVAETFISTSNYIRRLDTLANAKTDNNNENISNYILETSNVLFDKLKNADNITSGTVNNDRLQIATNSTLGIVKAGNNINIDSGTGNVSVNLLSYIGDIEIIGDLVTSNLTILGDKTTLETNVFTTEKLEINNTGSDTAVSISQSGNTFDILNVSNSTNEVFTIINSGFVGIGIQNPESILDVNGNVTVRSNLNVSGNINSITPTELNYLSGLNYNVKSQVDDNSNNLAQYVTATSNVISEKISNTSNVISDRVSDTCNYILSTSNDISAALLDTSNAISDRIDDTSNYVSRVNTILSFVNSALNSNIYSNTSNVSNYITRVNNTLTNTINNTLNPTIYSNNSNVSNYIERVNDTLNTTIDDKISLNLDSNNYHVSNYITRVNNTLNDTINNTVNTTIGSNNSNVSNYITRVNNTLNDTINNTVNTTIGSNNSNVSNYITRVNNTLNDTINNTIATTIEANNINVSNYVTKVNDTVSTSIESNDSNISNYVVTTSNTISSRLNLLVGTSDQSTSNYIKSTSNILFDKLSNANNISTGTVNILRLPIATNSTLGIVKAGNNININNTSGDVSVNLASYAGNVEINGNLLVTANLVILGERSVVETVVYTTEKLEISNIGSDVTATITQLGSTYDILNVFNNTKEVFTIINNGNVGIGIENPSSILDVGGNVKIHSNLNLLGNINNITPTQLNYLSGINYNIKSRIDNNDADTSNYILSTSNDISLNVADASNYIVATSNVISTRLLNTSNAISARLSGTSNYAITTSNLISTRLLNTSNAISEKLSDTYNYAVDTSNAISTRLSDTSNTISTRLSDTSNYILDTSNAISANVLGTSNYAVTSSNVISVRLSNTSNAIAAKLLDTSNYAIAASNAIARNVLHTSNYVLDTSNAISLHMLDTSNYVLDTSNAISTNVSDTSNYVLATSNDISSRLLNTSNTIAIKLSDTSNYVIASSNSLYLKILDTSNYSHATTNTIAASLINTSNAVSTHILDTSNDISIRIDDTCNYVLDTSNAISADLLNTSNAISGRLTNTSNYVQATSNLIAAKALDTSNVISARIFSTSNAISVIVSGTSNYAVATSNAISAKLSDTYDYVVSTSNILFDKLSNADNITSGTINTDRLQVATNSTLGIVKAGNNININNGSGAASVNLASYAGNVEINGNLLVTSNFVVLGDRVVVDTMVYTDKLEITNIGSDVTASITQLGSTYDILNIFNSTKEVFTIINNGNVGIGIENPVSTLDVGGDVKIHSNLNLLGNINNITPTELNYLSGINYNIKSRIDNNDRDSSNYILATSNDIYEKINDSASRTDTSNYISSTSNIISADILAKIQDSSNNVTRTSNLISADILAKTQDSSNNVTRTSNVISADILATSNAISGRVTNTCNYVLATSNVISRRINDTSNYVLETSNSISGRVTDTCNYVLGTSNVISGRVSDTCNYVLSTSNNISASISDTSNAISGRVNDTSNYALATSNLISRRLTDTCNYVLGTSNVTAAGILSTSNAISGRVNDTSNYAVGTSNIISERVSDTCNYVLGTSNVISGRVSDTCNYVLGTSNVISARISDTCNYVLGTSNLIAIRANDTSNYAVASSNVISGRVSDTCNYVLGTSNVISGRISDTCNYVLATSNDLSAMISDTSNVISGRVNNTSNYAVAASNYTVSASNLISRRVTDTCNYVLGTSNVISARVSDTCNYVDETSNLIAGRVNDTSNYTVTTSNIISRRITNTCNYVLGTSNVISERVNDTSNYILATSNAIMTRIENTTLSATNEGSNIKIVDSKINVGELEDSVYRLPYTALKKPAVAYQGTLVNIDEPVGSDNIQRMYPPVRNFVADNTTVSGQAYGNGLYEVSYSTFPESTPLLKPFTCFNTEVTEGGNWAASQYTSRIYNGTSTIDGVYLGEWLKIKLPVAIKLNKFGFLQRTSSQTVIDRSPNDFKIYGSSDGINWDVLASQTTTNYVNNLYEENITNQNYYLYYGLVVNKIFSSGTQNLSLDEWFLYGTEFITVEPVTIDADYKYLTFTSNDKFIYDFTNLETQTEWVAYARSLGTLYYNNWYDSDGAFITGTGIGYFEFLLPFGYDTVETYYGSTYVTTTSSIKLYIDNVLKDQVNPLPNYKTYKTTYTPGQKIKITEDTAAIIGKDLKFTFTKSQTQTQYTVNFPENTESSVLIIGNTSYTYVSTLSLFGTYDILAGNTSSITKSDNSFTQNNSLTPQTLPFTNSLITGSSITYTSGTVIIKYKATKGAITPYIPSGFLTYKNNNWTVQEEAAAYALPIATSTILGGVKAGNNVNIDSGTGNVSVNLASYIGDVELIGNLTTSNLTILGDNTTLQTNIFSTEKLEISNTGTDTSVVISQAGATYDILNINNSSKRVFTMLNSGFVGIGTDTPLSILDVHGTVNMRNDLIITGNLNTITPTELSYLSGLTYNIKSQVDSNNLNNSNYVLGTSNVISGRVNDTSNYAVGTSNIISERVSDTCNYVLGTSNVISGRVSDTCNYVLGTSNVISGRVNDTSNYVLGTSNVISGRVSDTCNYVLGTSNVISGRVNDTCNYVLGTSNVISGRVSDTCNYVLGTSNLISGRVSDTCNYVLGTSNVISGRVSDTCNYVLGTSNLISARVSDTCNYVLGTSNVISGRISDTCNYVLGTSNVISGRVTDTSNYVLGTSNVISGRVTDTSNYVLATSNAIMTRIENTTLSATNEGSNIKIVDSKINVGELEDSVYRLPYTALKKPTIAYKIINLVNIEEPVVTGGTITPETIDADYKYLAFPYVPIPDLIHDFTPYNDLTSWNNYATSIGATNNFQRFDYGGVFNNPGDGFFEYILPNGYNQVKVNYSAIYGGRVDLYIDNVLKQSSSVNQLQVYIQTYTTGQVLKLVEMDNGVLNADLIITLSSTQTEYNINFPTEGTECSALIIGNPNYTYISSLTLFGTYNILVGNTSSITKSDSTFTQNNSQTAQTLPFTNSLITGSSTTYNSPIVIIKYKFTKGEIAPYIPSGFLTYKNSNWTVQEEAAPVATDTTLGIVKVDGTTIIVDADGTITSAGGGGAGGGFFKAVRNTTKNSIYYGAPVKIGGGNAIDTDSDCILEINGNIKVTGAVIAGWPGKGGTSDGGGFMSLDDMQVETNNNIQSTSNELSIRITDTSNELYSKLQNADNINTGTINNLRLPKATNSTLGVVKAGGNISIDSGTGNVSVNMSSYTGDIELVGNLTTSNLTVLGDKTTLRTNVFSTEQLAISNSGTGTSVAISQLGATYDILNITNTAGSVLRIINNGNVGIGITNPTYHLDIVDTETSIAAFRNLTLTSGIGIGADSIIAIGSALTQNITIGSKSTGNLILQTNSATRLTIAGDGNITTTGSITTTNSAINAGTGGISGGTFTCTSITAGSGSITGGALSCSTISTNNNTITAGTGAISGGALTCASLSAGTGAISGGALTCTTITTANNTISAGTASITGGAFTCASLSAGTGGISGGALTCASLSAGTGAISGGALTCTSIGAGTGAISGGALTCTSITTTNNTINAGTGIITGGSVGIGSATPAYKLDALSDATYIAGFRHTNLTAGIGIGNDRIVAIGSAAAQNITLESKTTGSAILRTNGVDRITVLGGGNVGIGSLTPNVALDVAGSCSISNELIVSGNKLVVTGVSPTVYFRDIDNRTGMIHMNSDTMYFLNGNGANSDTWTQQAPYSQWALTINMSTNVSTFGGDLNAYGNITAYFSDNRLKTYISDIKDPLAIIKSLKGFYYTPNDIAKSHGFKSTKKEIGLSAQDVQKVLPELISIAPFDKDTDKEGNIISKSGENFLTMSYDRLAPVLVEAVKELNKQNDVLKQENIELKQKYDDLLQDMILVKKALNLM